MVQAVAHCGMECKFKQLNVRAEKVFLTLRSLRYALCVMTRRFRPLAKRDQLGIRFLREREQAYLRSLMTPG